MFLTVKSVFYLIKTPYFYLYYYFVINTQHTLSMQIEILAIYTHGHCILDSLLAFTKANDEIQY